MDFELGDTSKHCYGVAVDIGTTTLVASLMDLCTGEELAIASSINPQTSFGDDVVSRIMHAGTEKGLKELRAAVVTAISSLIDRVCESAGIPRDRIYDFACAGNTTMEHLFCGVDVSPLAVVPFVSAFGRGLVLSAEDVGLKLHPRAAVYVFPVIGGFVGGDTVAGMVATKLADHKRPVLLVDVGTNGEIVLAADGQFLAASTAAGPAFEGARIACGMRAAAGAIEKVIIDGGDLQINVIDHARPTGLCGSGLIDLAAELLTAGLINSGGRLLPPADLPAGLSEALRRRVRLNAEGRVEFVLVEADAHGPCVFLSERDVRELQLATGAIRAGVNILLRRAGLRTQDLHSVLIAGGFGSFIRRSKAQRIGLLPEGLPHERIRYVGNASLDGAKWALLSTRAHDLAETLARQTRHVNLSEDLEFQMEFAEAMLFPE
ncbi:MAG: ASKHA domain-containing protein [Planctomycetota bacterium]|nr:ASKHA domain-containing protein [Planctomycetota bacterium]